MTCCKVVYRRLSYLPCILLPRQRLKIQIAMTMTARSRKMMFPSIMKLAKDYKGLWQLVKKIILYGFAVSAVLMLASFLFYRPIGNVFSNDTIVLETFYAVFFILILGLPINTVAFVLDGLFKGLGEMKYLRNTLLVATFVGFVPVLFLGKYLDWKLYGIWIAFTVWMLIRGGALVWKFRKKFRPLLQNA